MTSECSRMASGVTEPVASMQLQIQLEESADMLLMFLCQIAARSWCILIQRVYHSPI